MCPRLWERFPQNRFQEHVVEGSVDILSFLKQLNVLLFHMLTNIHLSVNKDQENSYYLIISDEIP